MTEPHPIGVDDERMVVVMSDGSELAIIEMTDEDGEDVSRMEDAAQIVAADGVTGVVITFDDGDGLDAVTVH